MIFIFALFISLTSLTNIIPLFCTHNQFRDACPPHKVKDLDALVKQCKGNEEKIQAKIAEWWEEPQTVEPEWEAVDRKAKKAPEKKSGGFKSDRGPVAGVSSGGGGRRSDRGPGGRDAGGRGMSRMEGRGGRGGGRYGDRDRDRDRAGAKFGGGMSQRTSEDAPSPVPAPVAQAPPKQEQGIPAPVTIVPAPKGAWGQSFAAAAASAPAAPPVRAPAPTPAPAPEPMPEMPPAMEPEEIPVDLGPVNIISDEDPTPSGLPSQPKLDPAPLAPATNGNVWATRGSAHLIQAEKFKPISASLPIIQQAPSEPEEPEVDDSEQRYEETQVEEEQLPVDVVEEPLPESELEPEPEPEHHFVVEDSLNSVGVTLDSVLPPSVNGANINASGWEPLEPTPQPSVDIMPQPSPVGAISVATAPSMPEPIALEEPVSLPVSLSSSAPAAPVGVKPSSVLNMGHWETGDVDDELDFGFGSFAPENDNEVLAETSTSAPSGSQVPSSIDNTPLPAASAAATHASPARPPPGLSMPPMPANAMLVHELENKLESTSLGQKPEDSAASNLPEKKDLGRPNQSSNQPQSFNSGNDFGGHPGMPQYGGYGMGMYNYGASSMAPGTSNGFGSMPPGQFPLGGAVNQQQPKPQQSGIASQPQGPARSSPQTLGQGVQQQGPYGVHNPAATTANDTSGAPSNDGPNASTMPPGMPGMQYPNPAYMYGQFNQMGHPAYAGLQYGYGQQQQYGVQGGFGYHQQVMGHQGGGYGGGYGGGPGPHDDQGAHGNHPSHMRDNHQGGGYRGRNHHQNKYGNNYQSQGGYGGGYQSQGGYGGGQYGGGGYGQPGMDQYGMQQQGGGYGSGGGGFSHQENNDHGKGKSKGPHRGGNQQFQQQSYGMQGSSTDTGTGGSGGWPASGQSWGGSGAGGWQQDS